MTHALQLDFDGLRAFAGVGKEAHLTAGRLLIERGQHGSGLYVILEGSVVVDAPDATRELGPGSCVGELALLSDDGLRTARVTALTDVRVLAVSRADFERVCAEDPRLRSRLQAAARP